MLPEFVHTGQGGITRMAVADQPAAYVRTSQTDSPLDVDLDHSTLGNMYVYGIQYGGGQFWGFGHVTMGHRKTLFSFGGQPLRVGQPLPFLGQMYSIKAAMSTAAIRAGVSREDSSSASSGYSRARSLPGTTQ